jgi:hypothetical protein
MKNRREGDEQRSKQDRKRHRNIKEESASKGNPGHVYGTAGGAGIMIRCH